MTTDADRFTQLVRLAPGPCLLLADGVITAANDELSTLTSIPGSRLVGVPLAELLLPDLETAFVRAIDQATSAVTVVRSRLNASLVPLELSIRRLDARHLVVGVRSTAAEHHYSALAGAELTHDLVTGLANRHHVLALLHQRVTTADKTPLALIALWVDELPRLAVNRGDRAADRVLREVGQRLQARLRSPDVLGRFDESGFLGLLGSEAPSDQLTEIAERLRAEVAFPVEVDNGLISFTASVAVGSITSRRPSIQRILGRLEAAAVRVGQGGNRTDVLDL